jgi:hypothetical protein
LAYNQFATESGGTAEDRRNEMNRLVEMISDHSEELSPKEASFIEQMEDETVIVSTKQLFWARDIWAKVQ